MIFAYGKDWAKSYSKSAERNCIYYNPNNTICKAGCGSLIKRHCADCDVRLDRNTVIGRHSLSKELQALIDESHGKMLFIEYGDERYPDELLIKLLDEIFARELEKYIDIDASGNSENHLS